MWDRPYGVQTFRPSGLIGKQMRRLGVTLIHALIGPRGNLVVLHILERAKRPCDANNVGMLFIAPCLQLRGGSRERQRLEWSSDLELLVATIVQHRQSTDDTVTIDATWVPAIGGIITIGASGARATGGPGCLPQPGSPHSESPPHMVTINVTSPCERGPPPGPSSGAEQFGVSTPVTPQGCFGTALSDAIEIFDTII